jgi:hypothetical protein
MSIAEKYFTKTKEVPNKPGSWNSLQVEIFLHNKNGDDKIGEYKRNYSHLYNTFVPFVQQDKEYALYSREYTATRVMTLPDCKDLCGEERDEFGFCPVDYFVPHEPEEGTNGEFGFVAGCIWGDDISWKVEFLDLRKINEGILVRDDRFGYIPLPDRPLSQCISMRDFYVGKIEGEDFDDRIIRISEEKIFILDENYEVIKQSE